MPERSHVRVWLTLCLIPAPIAAAAPTPIAEQEAAEPIEEIVVVGSRRQNRTVTPSPVPVDVFQGLELRNIGTSDIDDILRTLIPSYNVERYALHDESSLVRPATVRGLPTGNTLILVNGKRRHRGAVLAGAANGAQGPDMTALPAMAMQRVEVLRDGASAQYGSDAIAGVINLVTKDSAEGLTVELETGEFYAGDGRMHQLGINAGLPVASDGFANLSLELGESGATSRSVPQLDATMLQELGAVGIPNPPQSWGNPDVDHEIKLFANTAIPIRSFEIYAFGNYAKRKSEIDFFWRNPNFEQGVYALGPERLVLDLTEDGSGNCPTAGSPDGLIAPDRFFPTQAEFDADMVALEALAADPQCWVVNEIYPSGYRPDFGANITDWSAVMGLRGERRGGLRYDLSISSGTSDVEYRLSNSLNPSMGPDSPTRFRPRDDVQSELSLNVDLAWPVEVGALYSPLNVAAGFEWREEQFEVVAGNDPSWRTGPLHTQGAAIGSHGFPGTPPEQAGTWDRASIALYLDLEADVTRRLLLGAAVRYEHFDDFGSTTDYKGAFRYELNDLLAVRGSASTGFRAPTPGQSNATNLSTVSFQGELRQVGLIQPTNPVAMFYGGRTLEPERSDNLSAGLSFQPLEELLITADFFRIDLKDAISIGPLIEVTADDVAQLIDLGVPGASDLALVHFFGNGGKLRTKGVDVVAAYEIDWGSAGSTELSFAWNRIRPAIVSAENPDRRLVGVREGRPEDRMIVTMNHVWNNLSLRLRASYYDSWIDIDFLDGPPPEPVCTDARPNPTGTDHCYGDLWVVDVEAAYTFKDRYTIAAGADNVFDTFPDVHFGFPFTRGEKYPGSSPIGYNGGFWYLRFRGEL